MTITSTINLNKPISIPQNNGNSIACKMNIKPKFLLAHAQSFSPKKLTFNTFSKGMHVYGVAGSANLDLQPKLFMYDRPY